MTTATQESLERVAADSWAYREGREQGPNPGQTSNNFRAREIGAKCSTDGCPRYAAPPRATCYNHSYQSCPDCGKPIRLASKRCRVCAQRNHRNSEGMHMAGGKRQS